ncbi:hypothetical protein GCM10007061_19440 [Kocuria marina]|nr:hypothetical protein GCM10007061_19440 [Kocuria marina]
MHAGVSNVVVAYAAPRRPHRRVTGAPTWAIASAGAAPESTRGGPRGGVGRVRGLTPAAHRGRNGLRPQRNATYIRRELSVGTVRLSRSNPLVHPSAEALLSRSIP